MIGRILVGILVVIGLLYLLNTAFPDALNDKCQRSEIMC